MRKKPLRGLNLHTKVDTFLPLNDLRVGGLAQSPTLREQLSEIRIDSDLILFLSTTAYMK
jgi:hypothetical protein